MTIRVESEIGPLRRVLVHRPGDEIVRMTQHDLELALFDDILAPDETRHEHDTMVEILRGGGAEVLEIQDLLVQALRRAPEEARQDLLERVAGTAGAPTMAAPLQEWEPTRLAAALVTGVDWDDVQHARMSLARIRAQAFRPNHMALRPVANLMFMRDPCMSVFDSLVVGRMATKARAREPLLVAFAVEHSGVVAEPRLVFRSGRTHHEQPFRSLEGGDVLVISPEVLLIGCSERTSAPTIERLAREALFPNHPRLRRVYAMMMPEARSVMHLDTILTQVDRTLFLGHRPLVAGQAERQACDVARLERDQPAERIASASVIDVLREELGPEVELVPCGGDDPLYQEREQWTDGANAVCLGPGKIILYARNQRTIAALAGRGFSEVRLHAALEAEERAARIADGMARDRVVFSLSGSELSRARGGARCLTMPLARDALSA